MIEFSVHLIRGVSLCLEFPEQDERPEDMSFGMVVDLLIFRFMLGVWKVAE